MSEEIFSIADVYSGRSVLITGGTGFLGKALVEKLLRSCPNVKHVYMLMRPKKDQNIDSRLENFFKNSLFDKIREFQPFLMQKVITVAGDIEAQHLGLSDNDSNILIENVSIVFHSAATIQFNKKLREAINTNILGTKRMIDFCSRMKLLKSFVYVSTAYSNSIRHEIDEVIYEHPVDLKDLLAFHAQPQNDFLDEVFEKKLLAVYPNTYVVTKAMTEQLLQGYSQLPIDIVRPSIIISSRSEPVAGWIDSINGPFGIHMAFATGILHSFYVKKEKIVDTVPVDMVVNLMIAAGWKRMMSDDLEMTVYNMVCGADNPLSYEKCHNLIENSIHKYPFEKTIWYPSIRNTSSKLFYHLLLFFDMLIAYCFDFLLKLCGKKPYVIKAQQRIFKAAEIISWIFLNDWNFSTKNVQNLHSMMTRNDKKTFIFDVNKINWPEFSDNYIFGLRKFMFKEDPSTIEKSRKNLFWLKVLDRSLKTLLVTIPVLVVAAFGF